MGNKFIVWGTGQEARKLMEWVTVANVFAKKIVGEIPCEVVFFWDSNIKKTKQLFYDRKVEMPQVAFGNIKYPIVVAVAKNEEIIFELETHGFCRNKNYLTLKDFYVWFWCESCWLWRLIDSLGLKDNNFMNGMKLTYPPRDISDMFDKFEQELSNVCEQRNISNWIPSLQRMIMMAVVFADCNWPDKRDMGKKLLNMVGGSTFVTYLEDIYKENTAAASEWMPFPDRNLTDCVLPRTIGIYYVRYFNGGVERVLSKLFPLFKSHGYRIVFFTDIIKEELEYDIPNDVVRVMVGYEGGRKERCERFLEAIKKHKVDVFCSHAYGGNILYDIFCIRQAGIPVVLEYHNNFRFIMDVLGKNAVALACGVDVLVTLSRVDEMFWRLMGGNSIYVPNPVEPAEDEHSKVNPYTILWLQRIDQLQKKVLDLPIIMEYVTQEIPEAQLYIVGASDKPEIEGQLREMIKERGLTGNMKLLGFHTDVGKFYRQATVMLMTSAFEGFPMTVAESKRYGVPLVMYELPYLELLRDKKGYIPVPQNDRLGAANALIKVLRDEELRNRLSREAKESLTSFLEIDLMVAWEKVWYVALGQEQRSVLSEDEMIFGEIERLLLEKIEKNKLLTKERGI